ncbi:excisionase [Amedibacillus sp. YH-ame10]
MNAKKQISIKDKALLNVNEMMAYTGWGENTVRNELNHPKCLYVVRKGNRLYANRKLLDKYLESISGV